MKSVVAGGHRLEFEQWGSVTSGAPTLVFLHEGLGCVAMWRGFPAAVAEATGCRALVYSRAGYGGSDPIELPRPTRYMHDEAARALPELLDAIGVRSAILIGHSDGASIALIHAGSDASHRIEALVLEAPHVFVEDISVTSIAAAKRAYDTGDLRARLERYHGSNTDGAFRGWNDVWLSDDFRAWNIEEYLPRIRVPALVVQGEEDAYGTLAQIEAIQAKSGGPVERSILPSCGHSPHRDRPNETLDAIVRFVATIATR
jgi:pimeloyl-ACP methyl ester carboxylesterase